MQEVPEVLEGRNKGRAAVDNGILHTMSGQPVMENPTVLEVETSERVVTIPRNVLPNLARASSSILLLLFIQLQLCTGTFGTTYLCFIC